VERFGWFAPEHVARVFAEVVSVDSEETAGADNSADLDDNITNGSFANIQNNPSLQEVSFAVMEARYFRFTSLRAIWNSGWTSAAEISVVSTSSEN
jgi:hypothetical protein